MGRDEAIAWVDKYRPLLEKRLQKVVHALPYDLEDYIQDAYETALISERISARNGLSLSSVFWIILKRWKRRASVSIAVNDCEEYQEENLYQIRSSIPDPEEELLMKETFPDHRYKFLLEFMDVLSQNERNVLTSVMGLSGRKLSYRETAAFLGITRGAISQIVDRIAKKAEEFRNKCGSPDGNSNHWAFEVRETCDGSERGEFIIRNTAAGYQEDAQGRAFAGSP